MAMENGILQAASDAELSRASDHLAQVVDRYVMAVTEGICSLEKQDRSVRERPEFIARKARILECLDALDGLVASFRQDIELERARPCVPLRRHGG